MSGRIQVCPKEERTADGIVFQSRREMEAYRNFAALLRRGVIRFLGLQVRFALHAVNRRGKRRTVSHYVADFTVVDLDNKLSIYDAKGHQTAEYKRSKKWFEHQYWPLRILEI